MNTIYLNDSYYLTYGIKHEKKRQIFLYYVAPINNTQPSKYRKKCFWTLIDDTRYGKREPHFLMDEFVWLLKSALDHPSNYSQEGSMTPRMVINKKCQILWIFTHLIGREFTQNVVDKLIEISGINLLEVDSNLVWPNQIDSNIWVKPLQAGKSSWNEPKPLVVKKPIEYEGIPYIEMDAPIGYLEEIKWITYDDEKYEISSIENQLDEIEEEEAEKTQKLYTPHRDALIITTLEPTSKIEIMYYQEPGNEKAPVPKFDLGWIEPEVEIVYVPQDYDIMEKPLTKLQESITVEINPGYQFKSQENLYEIDDVTWQKHPEKGWICVDERLLNCTMFSIRDFRNTEHPDYYLLTELFKKME